MTRGNRDLARLALATQRAMVEGTDCATAWALVDRAATLGPNLVQ